MKSERSTIGAMKLSETALKLETAARDKDMEYCAAWFPVFREKLLSLHQQLSAIFPEKKTEGEKEGGDTAFLYNNINKAIEAASDFDMDSGFKAINDLLAYDFGGKNNGLLESAAEAFMGYDYEAAKYFLSKLLPFS
jgi:hypothetical protein